MNHRLNRLIAKFQLSDIEEVAQVAQRPIVWPSVVLYEFNFNMTLDHFRHVHPLLFRDDPLYGYRGKYRQIINEFAVNYYESRA